MRRADGAEYGIHRDPLNSVIAHSDSSGALVEQVRYEAYGRPIFIDARGVLPAANESFTGNPLAFTARLWDGSTDVYDYRKRQIYDPRIGRFSQEDPLGFYGGRETLFAYASDNPILLIDPMGLIDWQLADQNFCGFGFDSETVAARIKNGLTPYRDSLDQACMAHDLCYFRNGLTNNWGDPGLYNQLNNSLATFLATVLGPPSLPPADVCPKDPLNPAQKQEICDAALCTSAAEFTPLNKQQEENQSRVKFWMCH